MNTLPTAHQERLFRSTNTKNKRRNTGDLTTLLADQIPKSLIGAEANTTERFRGQISQAFPGVSQAFQGFNKNLWTA
ncbi:MAG: hypothetical protein A2479_04020 [Candidatus Magasanikbacteria bacterium RIFOXYC2_FULL_39_8]|nr:MAG: hypothetical protein A2479_04020 [Candidatus Magasanikbacteria bacterium RIFOXYC2_FULL_39_8]